MLLNVLLLLLLMKMREISLAMRLHGQAMVSVLLDFLLALLVNGESLSLFLLLHLLLALLLHRQSMLMLLLACNGRHHLLMHLLFALLK